MKTTALTRETTEIIVLSGKYDISEIIKFETQFKELLKKRPERIALNLSDLAYIDSSGIGSIIRCMNFASRDNIQFICFALNDSILSVFKMAKLDQYIVLMSEDEFNATFADAH